MNINDIETGLNNYESSPEKVLNAILQTTVKNQAMLEVALGLQTNLISVLTKVPHAQVALNVANQVSESLATIQADISSRLL